MAVSRLDPVKKRINEIVTGLARQWPKPRIELKYRNPLELLIATILAARAPDKLVNAVTKDLFTKYRTANDYAEADQGTLEQAIRKINFYKNKALAIRECCQTLVEQYHGQVPKTMEGLVQLKGVGRKTANVILNIAYGIPAGIIVDTHMMRVSQRLGLTTHTKPDKIEQDLCQLIPQEQWSSFSMRMILHGRYCCRAAAPDCPHCTLNRSCPSSTV